MTASINVEFDKLDELTGDNAEVYLFGWVESVEKFAKVKTTDEIKRDQADIVASLIKIIAAPEPFPQPGRALRNCIARCMIQLYTKGDPRTTFDGLQALLKIVQDVKVVDKDSSKVSSFYCIGELMAVFGSQFMSFMAEIASISLKLYKSSSSQILRYHALIALKKSLSQARKAVSENIAKDIFKQMRYGLSDKCLAVQRASSQVLLEFYALENSITLSEVELIIITCTKSLEVADQATRRSLSQLIGHILAATQVERLVSPIETKKDKKDKDKKEEDDDDLPPGQTQEVTKTVMTAHEMLVQLSNQFNKQNLSRKSRLGIFDFYVALFTKLGSNFVETNYSLITTHLMNDIVANTRNASTRYEVLLVRKLVGTLLRDLIGVRMLSEQGQIAAIQELSKSFLKRWPAMMPGTNPPSHLTLAVALREVAGLLQQLGNAPPAVQDAVSEPLKTLLSHPKHTIRVGASWALRCFCYSTPLHLPKIIVNVFEMLQRDVDSLISPAAPSDIQLRALGHAYGLACLITVIPERPLYVSFDISAKVLHMATQLLKCSGEHDVKVAAVEVEVAWTAMASLMALGPGFVRPHLPQLLVLWRNALPKPTVRDSAKGRSGSEWNFLLHVRDSAIGAILCFLRHNSQLLTLDVARRVASLLNNAMSFINTFVTQNMEEASEGMSQNSKPESQGLSLQDREAFLRRRIYQCYSALGFASVTDGGQAALLQSAISLFASVEGYTGSAVQAAIASSGGNFNSIWQCVDGYAYGVTSMELSDHGLSTAIASVGSDGADQDQDQLYRDGIDMSLDALNRKPLLGSYEHDLLSLFPENSSGSIKRMNEAPAPATSVVDAAILMFSQLLPLQSLNSTSKAITMLLDSVRSPKLDKNLGRKSAVMINSLVALTLALRRANTLNPKHSRETLGSSLITSLLTELTKDTLIDADPVLRAVTAEAIGSLASLAGSGYLNAQIKTLVDQVVNNRDPACRAGCALAFGSIYSRVGSLAAGPLLKTTVNLLMSLSSDSHPVVHFWALNALAMVIHAASLAYTPFVPSTLGLLLKIYLLESHEVEGGTLLNANLSGDLPAYPIACHVIDAIITILGPDIQESAKTRNLILHLVHEFSHEDNNGTSVQSILCIQHFLMFAPEHVDIPELVTRFRKYLSLDLQPRKLASIKALYQLVQKDALSMSRLGGDKLVEDLFAMLDDDSSLDGVRNVITSWLEQTVIHNPSAWIDLCQRIMSRTAASQQVTDTNTKGAVRDDEGASLSVGMTSGNTTVLTSRWRTQLFALQCLHQICVIVGRSGRREHIDIPYARSRGLQTRGLLVSRVPDLIKMAFTASTAYVTEIRLEGLVVLQDVIQIFSSSPDPEYSEALLLEQHQAPITAALTPAFSADSTPEILASAVHASAIFVGCGVVTDVSRMGRILKLLTTALDQSKGSGLMTLGEAGVLSPNASAMLRISSLSAWAQLEIASQQQSYLVDVLKPYRDTLSFLWIASLRDYASIRAESEIVNDASLITLDSYSSLGKEVLLPYYVESWPVILRAVANVMQAGDPAMQSAMDGQEKVASNGAESRQEEPRLLFFIIFGLIFESLTSAMASSTSAVSDRHVGVIAGIQALTCLVRPEYSGKILFEPITFEEFINLGHRMIMTEPAQVIMHVIPMIAALVESVPATADDTDIFSPQTPTSHCLRMCTYVLRHANASARGPAIRGDLADRIHMINVALSFFTKIATLIQSSQREEVRSVAIFLYSELLKDETSEIDLVTPTLPALKALLEIPVQPTGDSQKKLSKVVHGLFSACLINCDEMSGREGAISSKKIKANLLTSVLILTVLPHTVLIGRPIIERSYNIIGQRLLEVDETSLTAAHCVKALVTAASSGHPTPGKLTAPGAILRATQCVKHLLPFLVEIIAKANAVSDTQTQTLMLVLAEVWKTFSIMIAGLEVDEQRSRVIGILLPLLIFLLQPESSSTKNSLLHSQSVSQIMNIASNSPSAFREATSKLDQTQRTILEAAVRKAMGAAQSSTTARAAGDPGNLKPKIELRSF